MTAKFAFDDSSSSVGLNLTSDPFAFAKGEYSFLLNGSLHGSDGGSPFVRMFPGTILSAALPAGFYPVCNLPINHRESCVFSVSPGTGISEIGIFDGKRYTTKVQSPDLGFDIRKQIQATSDEDFNGHNTVVWVQEDAPIRFMDLNNIPMLGGVLDVDALNVFKLFSYPQVKIVEVSSNGRVPAGSYYICVQYADENGNGLASWSTPVGPVYIYRDSMSQPKEHINGSPDREPTGKSISIQVDDLDPSFKFYNVGVVKSFAGIREPFVVQTLPTLQNTYLYTGNTETEVATTLDEIIIPTVSYSSAKTISRSNGSILIGNLKGRQEYNLQPEMNKIQVLWQTQREQYSGVKETSANPLTGAYYMALRRNEIYALGIVIRWTDGTKSRVYPLIPREKNKHASGLPITKTTDSFGRPIPSGEWDSYQYPPSFDIYEGGPVPERYKIFNTGFKMGTDLALPTNVGAADYGEFGYWESTERYPNDPRVWGVNAGLPIRHFMAPDFVECPLTDGENGSNTESSTSFIYRLGLRFSNVEDVMNALPPEIKEQMSGWELVRGDRRNNKSVIASGLLYNMWEQDWRIEQYEDDPDHNGTTAPIAGGLTGVYQKGTLKYNNGPSERRLYANYPLNDINPDRNIAMDAVIGGTEARDQNRHQSDIYTFVSADTEFDKTKLLAGSLYIHYEAYGVAASTIQMLSDFPLLKHNKQDEDYHSIFYHAAVVGHYNNWIKPYPGNMRRQLLEAMYIPFNSVVAGGTTGKPVHNRMRDATVLLHTNTSIKDPDKEDNSRVKISDSDFACTTNRNSMKRTASSHYASIISRLPNQYGSVFDTRYLATNLNSSNVQNNQVVFAGDTFIGTYGMARQMVYYQNLADYKDFPDGSMGIDLKNSFTIPGIRYYYTSVGKWIADNSNSECEEDGEGTKFIPMIYTGVPFFFTESDHNIDLQLNGQGEYETFYPNLKDGSLTIQKWNNVETIDVPKEHLINRAYEEQNDLFAYQNPDPFYDPDKKELTHYSTRTIYSLTATPENRVNNILIFKPLNYYDLRKDAGELWDIRDLGNNKMLFRMEHALFMDQKYATIPIENNKISLGSGKLFETEPVYLSKSDSGYLGTNAQWAFNSTPFGAFFIDSIRGVAVQFTDNAEDIGLKGADSYLATDLPLKLLKDIPFFKDFDNPANPNGIGYISVYDTYNKLWIITKRDYEVIDKSKLGRFSYAGNTLLYDGAPALLTDRSIFADTSFTFCYSVIRQRWVGWQSFLPTTYCVLNKEYYSFSDGAYWQHNKGLPRTYYGKRYPFVFEGLLRFDKGESLTHSCSWVSRTYSIINSIQQGESFVETFNKAIFYNNQQCTGLSDLTVQDENDLSTLLRPEIISAGSKERFLRRRERMWQVDELYDMVRNHEVPFFTTDTNMIGALYYMDKVLDNNNIDYSRDYKESAILNDVWMKYRLIYDKDKDVQLYLYLALGVTEQVVT